MYPRVAAGQLIIANVTPKRVVAATTRNGIIARAVINDIVICPAAEHVRTIRAVKSIVVTVAYSRKNHKNRAVFACVKMALFFSKITQT